MTDRTMSSGCSFDSQKLIADFDRLDFDCAANVSFGDQPVQIQTETLSKILKSVRAFRSGSNDDERSANRLLRPMLEIPNRRCGCPVGQDVDRVFCLGLKFLQQIAGGFANVSLLGTKRIAGMCRLSEGAFSNSRSCLRANCAGRFAVRQARHQQRNEQKIICGSTGRHFGSPFQN